MLGSGWLRGGAVVGKFGKPIAEEGSLEVSQPAGKVGGGCNGSKNFEKGFSYRIPWYGDRWKYVSDNLGRLAITTFVRVGF